MEMLGLTQWSEKVPAIQVRCLAIGSRSWILDQKVKEVVKANCYSKNLGCKMGQWILLL